MLSLSASSGDPVADRRLQWAEALFAEGDPAEAARLLAEAVAMRPDWAAGQVRLGEFHLASGDAAAAARAFGEALRCDPSDRLGAGLQLQLIEPGAAQGTMPPAFVETLFDAYAGEFDAALGRLDYRGPELVAEAVARGGPARRTLDLGCGTGLLGQRLRAMTGWLEGCDISAEMLARAEARGSYDRLEKRDLTAMPPVQRRFDLIVAADVVMYIGALDQLSRWIAGALEPGGRLIFTAETLEEGGSGFALGEARRYRHSAGYLAGVLAGAGFAPPQITQAVVRRDRGQPVPALVVSAALAEAGARPASPLPQGDTNGASAA